MRRVALTVATFLIMFGAANAADREQTLADIRQELSVLYVEINRLKRELSTSGAPETLNLQGTSALDRINAIESELQRLTSATEQLTNRVNSIVRDGTNRIGDLEFRLVELEGGDISQLGETTTLGGDQPDLPVAASVPESGGAEFAVGEQADFDRAREAFEAGAYENAVIQFATFAESYPGGALAAESHYWRGRSLTALGNTSGAARAYLESFSGDPSGSIAPSALLQLGLSLDTLGQVNEACVMLSEVTSRFPTSDASVEAQAARVSMGCA